MERDAKRFKVYNAKNGQLIMSVPSGKASVTGGSFIAADLVTMVNNKQNVTFVVTTSSDNIIKLWDPTTNYQRKDTANTPVIQLCVKWAGAPFNKIFTAGLEGEIHAYSYNNNYLKDVGKNEE